MVHEKIVFGCKSKDLRAKLIKKVSTLTLLNTLEIAHAHLLSRDQINFMSEKQMYMLQNKGSHKGNRIVHKSQNSSSQMEPHIYVKYVAGITRPSALKEGKSATNSRRKSTFHPCLGTNQSTQLKMWKITHADEGSVYEGNAECFR